MISPSMLTIIIYANSYAITLQNVLESDTRASIPWCYNYMDSNPGLFQRIILNWRGDVSISLSG